MKILKPCPFCNQILESEDNVFDCKAHNNWDVKYIYYDAKHGYKKTVQAYQVYLSTDDKYMIELHYLNNKTSFWKFDVHHIQPKSLITTLPGLQEVTPDNASQWMERILNIKVFS